MTIELDLKVQHFFSGREYAKKMELPAGYYAETHSHAYDHLSILAAGEVVVTLDGVDRKYIGPTCITIGANKMHRIDAVTDSVWFCVHATDEDDPEKIDQVLIKNHD